MPLASGHIAAILFEPRDGGAHAGWMFRAEAIARAPENSNAHGTTVKQKRADMNTRTHV